MYEERICEPEEHVAFVPLGIETPIAGEFYLRPMFVLHLTTAVLGAEEVNLSFSGLDQSEGFWIRRLARALGGSIASKNLCWSSTYIDILS